MSKTKPGEAAAFLEASLEIQTGDCIIWPYSCKGDGYALIGHEGKTRLVSRLICQRIHGDPLTPKHEAAHSCGRGRSGCINHRHLSWKTPKENQADKIIHGTHNRGERCGNAKLTAIDVLAIRALAGIMTQRAVARKFNVSQTQVGAIVHKRHWRHI